MNAEKQENILPSTFTYCLEELRRVGYGELEICKMQSFLSQFCATAQMYLTNLFVRARVSKPRKHFWTVLSICEVYRNAV